MPKHDLILIKNQGPQDLVLLLPPERGLHNIGCNSRSCWSDGIMESLHFAFVLQNCLLIRIRNPKLFVVLRSTLQYSKTPIFSAVYPGIAN